MGLIIVDGPDGSGKTTLIKGWDLPSQHYIHHGAYQGERAIAHHYMDSLMRAEKVLRTGLKTFVMDRSWLAEPIYGAAYRNGEDRIGPGRARMLERVALSLDALVVICLPPYEVCRDNWARRNALGQEYVTKESAFKAIYDGYVKLLQDLESKKKPLNVVSYDYTESSALFDRPLPDIVINRGPGAGHFEDNPVLLVGDRINTHALKGDATWWPPFVSFMENGCSKWLADQLEEAGISERSLYWINATDLRGNRTTPSFIDALKPRATVALGRDAEKWCIDASVTHYAVPHPQYWKRFKSAERYPLIDILRKHTK